MQLVVKVAVELVLAVVLALLALVVVVVVHVLAVAAVLVVVLVLAAPVVARVFVTSSSLTAIAVSDRNTCSVVICSPFRLSLEYSAVSAMYHLMPWCCAISCCSRSMI